MITTAIWRIKTVRTAPANNARITQRLLTPTEASTGSTALNQCDKVAADAELMSQ